MNLHFCDDVMVKRTNIFNIVYSFMLILESRRCHMPFLVFHDLIILMIFYEHER